MAETQLQIPVKIREIIKEQPYTIDDIGRSGNPILIFETMVLKIEDASAETKRQAEVLQWLKGKIPVPEILALEEADGKSYLLMSRVTGKMACDEMYLENPHILLEALVKGLQMLWEINIHECPYIRNLDSVLEEARRRVEQNLVDMDDAEPGTYGEAGFKDPKHLLEWLERNRPDEEMVFSHGDFCLPNILLEGNCVNGFIDLGKAGVSDKWCDIALCYRSLKHNFDGTYGGKVYENFEPERLFEKLGEKPDWNKLRYYILLDELF